MSMTVCPQGNLNRILPKLKVGYEHSRGVFFLSYKFVTLLLRKNIGRIFM